MLNVLTLLGAAGAGTVYAAKPFPALDAPVRHLAGLLAALAVGTVLWAAGVKFASALPAGWFAALLLLLGSQYQIESDDLVWVRVAAVIAVVMLLAQILG